MSWRGNVRRVEPYTPGEQPKIPGVIKLNTNENPYPPSPLVRMALNNFDVDVLKKYPDPTVSQLVTALAGYHQVDPEQVFVGVGSDDVLAMSFLTFFNGNKPIIFPDITYSFYDVWADLFKIDYEMKPLTKDFKINPEDYMVSCSGVVIANPNAPTGEQLDLEAIERIIAAHRECVVIVDEAYADFGTVSCLELVNKYDNLLVVRTFSKSRSLAGSRIGYAVGSKELIKYLNDCKFSFNSYTMDSLTIALGVASVADDAYFKETCAKVIKTRENTKEALKSMGFSMPDSQTNFVFATHESVPAEVIFEELKKRNIFVRYFKKPRINNYLRISIGTDEEMLTLIRNLEEIIEKQKGE